MRYTCMLFLCLPETCLKTSLVLAVPPTITSQSSDQQWDLQAQSPPACFCYISSTVLESFAKVSSINLKGSVVKLFLFVEILFTFQCETLEKWVM